MTQFRPSLHQAIFCAVAAAVVFGAWPAPAKRQTPATSPQPGLRWYKGNTHTHTLNSDGDSTPDEVARWYREHGYNFLVLTDHNYVTSVGGLNAVHGADEKFLVVKGEEVTDKYDGRPIHINGLNVERLVEPQGGRSVADTVQRDVDAIRGARGVPHVNHPNFGWAITAEDLKQVRNDRLFEIYNGHPQVNNLGGGGRPGLEEMWDILLTSGKQIYGLAVDDAHHFKRPWDRAASRPGRGWVMVRAERLAAPDILSALERGDFYASTGVELEDYRADGQGITVKVKEVKSSRYRVVFSGRGGRVLQEFTTVEAAYRIRGDEGYVRAKVIESNGNFAWTQPVFVASANAR
jgi:hypothetical protein